MQARIVTERSEEVLHPIGEASRRSGVHIETIRYYERRGLLAPPRRSGGGSRLYDAEQLKRLAFIHRGRELGFGLTEIDSLLSMLDAERVSCEEVHAITTAHAADIRRKIRDLRQLEKVLTAMAKQCGRGDVPDCPILDVLSAPP